MGQALDWINSVTDDILKQHYAGAAYEEGYEYAERGRVKHIVLSENGTRLRALVRGQSSTNYRTTIDIVESEDGPKWVATCTCPMGQDCKHSVALLVSARTQRIRETSSSSSATSAAAAPAKPAAADPLGNWRGVLGRVLDGSDNTVERVTPLTMGLQFQRTTAPHSPSEYRIKVRPMQYVDDEKWAPQAVTWMDLTRPGSSPPVRANQLMAFRALFDAHQVHTSRATTRGANSESVFVEDLGPSMWRLLRALHESGVEFLGHREGPETVELLEGQGATALDATRMDGTPDVHIRAVLCVGDEVLRGSAIKLLGDPAHGAAVMDPSRQQTPPTLRLVELPAPLTGPLLQMLATNRRLTIPGDDVPEFLGQFGPALQAQMRLLSSSDTVEVPSVKDPMLSLDVNYSPTRHSATLTWRIAYPVGEHMVHVPLLPGQQVSAEVHSQFPRNEQLEDQLRDVAMKVKLPRSAKASPSTVPDEEMENLHAVMGLPLAQVQLSSADTALFAHDHLPALKKNEQIHVTIVGTPPQFQPAAATPELTIEAISEDSNDDWFDLAVSIKVGGDSVGLRDVIAAMVHGDDAVVLDSGVWFSLDHPHLESLRRMVQESRELLDEEAGVVHLNMFRPDLWAELVRDSIVVGQSRRWLRQMQGLASLEEIPDPDDSEKLQATLRPYQHQGYRWLSFLWDHGLGGILADDMGLGKTMQTLAAICRQHEMGELKDPVLIVAPTSVVTAWTSEIRKFAPHLTAVPITQTTGKRGASLKSVAEGADIVVTSYTLLRLDSADYHEREWGAVIYDEAQFVKNHMSTTYKVARKLRAGFRLAVTGTPLENSLMDLWSLLSLTAAGLFPDPSEFTTTFRRPIEAGKAPEQLATLRRRIRPFMLRRSKSQVATDLPPKIEQIMPVDLSASHREVYETYLQRERQRVMGLLDDMPRNRMAIFQSLTLLRQLALDPSLVDSNYEPVVDGSKLGDFTQHMEELISEGHRALVFSQFTGYLGIVRKQLESKNIKYAYLDGSTRDRESAIKNFTEDEDVPVFLISLKAGGFGLTLTQADYVFVMDPWWNPAAEAQAIDRAHRIGQDKTVMVYRMVASNTIEEKVLALQDKKRALFEQVVDESAMLSSVLSAEDVRSLFT